MPQQLPNIRALSKAELKSYFLENGHKAFRATQVWEWLWQKSALSFEEMSNLSKEMRTALEADFELPHITLDLQQKSKDGTIKSRFKLNDGHLVEGVLIPAEDRFTACVSSQVGCSLSCKFCATGFLDLKRNLRADEIYDQVCMINRQSLEHHSAPLSNIVFMGMGEPLLNYKNVLQGIDRITAEDGLNISPKRITVSTVGIAKMIKKLGEDEVRFNLALSLHAANDTKRDKIMAINESNNIEVLTEALQYFHEKNPKSKISFEYILFKGFNDTKKDAQELIELCSKVPAKINIIEYNKVEDVEFEKAGEKRRKGFVALLEKAGITATVRRSRGEDIDAACGQLANKTLA
ncbi:MAG: 23S rRNA (adenine(2503)-C(2))-methyltransferase RlmN [Chitinophagales bacterium]